MRKLVLLLSTTTLGLAIACGHLYRELERERARETPAAAVAVPPSNDSVPVNDEVFAEPVEIDTRELVPAPDRGRESSNEIAPEDRQAAREARRAQEQAEFERRMQDPAVRAQRLAQSKAAARRQNPGIAGALRLSREEENALLELLATQQLQMQDARPRGRMNDPAAIQAAQQRISALSQQHQQEAMDLLGPARYEQYADYRRHLPEHTQIRDLRSRLDAANSLTASQTSQLIDAMYQERDSYLQQIKTAENFGGHLPMYPVDAFSNDRDPTARVQFAEEQLKRTEEFMARLRLRAASVLNAEQLRRFDEIQEEQLNASKSRLERQRQQAARRAGRR